MNKFSKRSLDNLQTCDYRLQWLFHKVLQKHDCSIICGSRGEEEQNEAFTKGTSKLKYPQSKHNKKPSIAVDVLPYPFKGWDNLEDFRRFAEVVKETAKEYDIDVVWGGDWKFVDMPHWELK
jgi:peptidoglycan LD-endopeptidase CwlK